MDELLEPRSLGGLDGSGAGAWRVAGRDRLRGDRCRNRADTAQADRERRLPSFNAMLAPIRATLSHQPWLGGDRPSYADHVVAAAFMWPIALVVLTWCLPTDQYLIGGSGFSLCMIAWLVKQCGRDLTESANGPKRTCWLGRRCPLLKVKQTPERGDIRSRQAGDDCFTPCCLASSKMLSGLDPDAYAALRRLLDVIEQCGAISEPQRLFEMIEEDLRARMAVPVEPK